MRFVILVSLVDFLARSVIAADVLIHGTLQPGLSFVECGEDVDTSSCVLHSNIFKVLVHKNLLTHWTEKRPNA